MMISIPLDSWVTMHVCDKDHKRVCVCVRATPLRPSYLVLLAGTLAVFSQGLQGLDDQVDV